MKMIGQKQALLKDAWLTTTRPRERVAGVAFRLHGLDTQSEPDIRLNGTDERLIEA